MTFLDYIKNNHPDPDTLLGKPVWEGMDELIKLHKEYLTQMVEKLKFPENFHTCDFNHGVELSIDKIEQS